MNVGGSRESTQLEISPLTPTIAKVEASAIAMSFKPTSLPPQNKAASVLPSAARSSPLLSASTFSL